MTVAMDSPSNVNALVEVKGVCWCSEVPVGGRIMVLVYEAGGSVDLGLNLRLSFKDERGRGGCWFDSHRREVTQCRLK